MQIIIPAGETVVIGEGGTNTINYFPSYSYYKYSLTQQIYTAEEIGTNGFIVDLYYTVYANPHENNFVTMSELDLSSVKEVTIDNVAYRQYKVK